MDGAANWQTQRLGLCRAAEEGEADEWTERWLPEMILDLIYEEVVAADGPLGLVRTCYNYIHQPFYT